MSDTPPEDVEADAVAIGVWAGEEPALSLIHISAVSYTHLTLPTTPYV